MDFSIGQLVKHKVTKEIGLILDTQKMGKVGLFENLYTMLNFDCLLFYCRNWKSDPRFWEEWWEDFKSQLKDSYCIIVLFSKRYNYCLIEEIEALTKEELDSYLKEKIPHWEN